MKGAVAPRSTTNVAAHCPRVKQRRANADFNCKPCFSHMTAGPAGDADHSLTGHGVWQRQCEAQVSGSPKLRRRQVRRRRRSASRRLRPELRRRHLARAALGPAARWIRPCASRRPPCPAWSATPIKERVQVFYRYKTLLEKNIDELAALITEENGKIASEARAEVLKSAELTEFACSLPQIIARRSAGGEPRRRVPHRALSARRRRGDHAVQLSQHGAELVDPQRDRARQLPDPQAVGARAAQRRAHRRAAARGRTCRRACSRSCTAGRTAVEAICDHPGIAAVSFVGSTKIAKVVYRRATSNLKRCLALGGAKNHLIVMPDADQEMTSSNVVASMSGCAGQRCMAASVMVAVSKTDHIIERMVERAKKIVPGKDIGPVISAAARERIEKYIDEAEAAGAKVLVDGRGTKVAGKEGGYYLGPTIIDHVTPDMKIAQEEVFGPVLVIVRTPNVDGALAIENASPYGNAASVFTESGGTARYVMEHASAGMVGVNVGVPVPREPFSFGGWNDSKFGVGDITGRGSIEFWTQAKKMTTKWNKEAGTNWMS